MAFNTASGQSFTLGSSISSTQTTILLSSFKVPVTNTDITMASMSTSIAYGTLAPGTTSAELISFTGVTQNADGTATLTGVTRGLNKESPYTSSSSFKQPHSGQTIFILSDAPQVFDQYVAKINDNTLSGNNTFSGTNTFTGSTIVQTPTLSTQAATKGYVDGVAVSGAPNASTTVKGIVELATQTEVDARTTTGGTGALLVPTPDTQRSTLLSDYKADTGSANAYAIAPVPAITAYTTGQQFSFKATNANTTASTLNVNSLGAKTIKKNSGSTDLTSGDIAAGQIVIVEYDGTNFQMLNPSALALNSNGDGSQLTNLPVTTAYSMSTDTADTYFSQLISPAFGGWTGSGTMTPTYYGGYQTLTSGAAAASYLTADLPGSGSSASYDISNNKILRVKFRVKLVSVASDRKGFGFCINTADIYSANTDVTNGEIRFITNSGTLYAQNANGSSQTSTDISSGLTLTNWNTYEIVFTPTTSALFYVNGTLKATHTTNLPTSGLLRFGWGVSANSISLYTTNAIISISN